MTHIYSNSELQSYKNCPLQWRFEWDLGLVPLGDESSQHHLRFGSAWHAGLAALYLGKTWGEIKDAFSSAYPVQLDLNDHAKTQENGVVALGAYINQWKEEDRKYRVVEVDTRSEAGADYSVQPDLILESLEHGGYFLMDHKTTGKYLNYDYWGKYEPNTQITHYLAYAQEKYGREFEGFFINAASFRYRERAYKGEPAGFWCKFERQLFNRRPEQLEYERRSREEWVRDIERSRDAGFFRTNTESCRFCDFKAICAPGWTWEEDAELILCQYRQRCRSTFAGGYCDLDRGHAGSCATVLPDALEPLNITIEV